MKKHLDLIAYPLMLGVVYVLLGFVNWDKDPGMWQIADRMIWVVWGLAWGLALQIRIRKDL
jgi:hypothetical protein